VILMAVTSPKLTGLAALVVPLVVLPAIVFGRKVRRLSRATQDRIGDVGAKIEETLSGMRIVQAFTQEAAERARFESRVADAFGAAMRRIRARALFFACVFFAVFAAVGLVLWVGGKDLLAGDITAGQLTAFLFFAASVSTASASIIPRGRRAPPWTTSAWPSGPGETSPSSAPRAPARAPPSSCCCASTIRRRAILVDGVDSRGADPPCAAPADRPGAAGHRDLRR
jgi:hypothetical protein